MQRRNWGIELGSMAAIGLVLALMGPFGTFALPLGLRLLDWQVFIFGGYGVFRPVVSAGSLVAEHSGIARWLAIGLACLFAAMPVTLLVGWAMSGMAWRGLTLETLIEIYPDVLLIGGAITLLQVVNSRVHSESAPPASEDGLPAALQPAQAAHAPEPMSEPAPDLFDEPEPQPDVRARFLARLPARHGEGLIALESEDHYVRVHSRAGSTLVLLRLADAVAELDGIEGLRTHRSWWVARDAVAEVLRRDRATSLRLVNGIEAPVARNAVADLRAAGWLGE